MPLNRKKLTLIALLIVILVALITIVYQNRTRFDKNEKCYRDFGVFLCETSPQS